MLFYVYLPKKSPNFFPAGSFFLVLQIKCLSKCPYFKKLPLPWNIPGPRPQSHWHFDIVVTWQIKNIISLLSQGLWTPNLVEWCRKMRERHPQSHLIYRSRGYVTNQKRFISTFTRVMAPKTRVLWKRSRDTLIVWSHEKSRTPFSLNHRVVEM